jgi:hypothetical protein
MPTDRTATPVLSVDVALPCGRFAGAWGNLPPPLPVGYDGAVARRGCAMTRKRLLLWAFVAVGAVALGSLTVVVLTRPRPGVTEDNYGRITYGMTLAEVEWLLGGEGEEPEPMGNTFVRPPLGMMRDIWASKEPMGNTFVRTWRGDGLTVYVSFQDGRVTQRARVKDGQGENEVPHEPFPVRLLRLLPW